MMNDGDISRIIEMAWEDRTSFDTIEAQFGVTEAEVIAIMRRALKPSSFRLWRKRVSGRSTKHQQLRSFDIGRMNCKTQYKPRQR